ncbi:hypothetical protein [Bacillus aquiflavi]|nr:hypothetical protein [Bacillus aquiflavi]
MYVNKTERNNIRFTGDVIVGDVRNDGKKYYIILGNGKGKSNE